MQWFVVGLLLQSTVLLLLVISNFSVNRCAEVWWICWGISVELTKRKCSYLKDCWVNLKKKCPGARCSKVSHQIRSNPENRKTSVSPCRPQHLEHYHTEHRCPTRLRAQPAALHAADPRLHCQVQLQPHHQVRWWHNSGRSHQQQRWNALQRGSWLNGVALTICPSMWVRQRRLWWTSGGRTPLTTPHWPSTARLWRESAALNSWGCTSRRISPGPPTPCHSPRRHNSVYTFSAGWKEQVSLHPSSPHSTGAPLRVCWPAASLSGMGTAVLLTARPPHQTPSNLTTPKKKTVNFFVQFKCATHRWVGLYKPPVAAHSPLCTRHFS